MLLLTGATGYIGQKLRKQLKSHVRSIAVLSRSARPELSAEGIHVIHGDLSAPETLHAEDFKEVTHVIHLAAITHAYQRDVYQRVNVEGTVHLLAVLPKNLKQFVYASTTCAEPGSGWYGESKLAAEKLIKKSVSNCVLLRVADVFGGSGEKSLERLIDQARKSILFPLVGSGEFAMAPVHVDDVVDALIRATELKGQHTLVIAGTEHWTMKGLVQDIYARFGVKRPILLPVPLFIFKTAAFVASVIKAGPIYPDQVARLTVKKNLNSEETWQTLGMKPKLFSEWLRQHVA